MAEIWKMIENFPAYEVSSLGRVRNIIGSRRFPPGHVLKSRPKTDGPYLVIGLFKDGRRYPFAVHRLVMDAFVGIRPEGYDRSHIDGDPTNNAVSNLTFEPASKNNSRKYGHGTGQRGSRGTNAKLTDEQVAAIRSDNRKSGALAKLYGCNRSTINRIRSKKTWIDLPNAPNGALHSARLHAPFQNGEISNGYQPF